MKFKAFITALSLLAPSAPFLSDLVTFPQIASSALAIEGNFNGEVVTAIGESSELNISSNRVTGTGSFVYQKKLDVIGPASSHNISFTLKEGGQLKLVVYADPTLGQGLEFVFSRSGNSLQGLILKNRNRSESLDFTAELSNVNASRVVNLQIDVHNSESPAHVLVWDGLETRFTEDTALLNTEETSFDVPGNGEGLRRGFVLRDATLLKSVATAPKFDH